MQTAKVTTENTSTRRTSWQPLSNDSPHELATEFGVTQHLQDIVISEVSVILEVCGILLCEQPIEPQVQLHLSQSCDNCCLLARVSQYTVYCGASLPRASFGAVVLDGVHYCDQNVLVCGL